MSDLIRREDALGALGTQPEMTSDYTDEEINAHYSWEKYANAIKSITAVDAVEVVRCRDCKHWVKTDSGTTCRKNILDFAPKHDDFFCAYGERREST